LTTVTKTRGILTGGIDRGAIALAARRYWDWLFWGPYRPQQQN